MEFFDSHSHLNDEKFDEDRNDLIEKIKKENISKFLTCGYNLEGSKKAIEIAKICDSTYATVGISPNDIPQNEEEMWKNIEEIKDLAQNKKVVAIGEIGLDYYWNKENRKMQLDAFKKQIEIANELNLPIVIHTREAVMDTISVLKENPVNNKGVFHCCPLNRELVKEALKLAPEDHDILVEFSNLHIILKDYGATKNSANQLIQLFPDDPFGYRFLGFAQAMEGDKKEARKNLLKAKELGDENAETIINKYCK